MYSTVGGNYSGSALSSAKLGSARSVTQTLTGIEGVGPRHIIHRRRSGRRAGIVVARTVLLDLLVDFVFHRRLRLVRLVLDFVATHHHQSCHATAHESLGRAVYRLL